MNHSTSGNQLSETSFAYPSIGLSDSVISHDDLAHNIHWRFGLSQQHAQYLANDMYRIIEN